MGVTSNPSPFQFAFCFPSFEAVDRGCNYLANKAAEHVDPFLQRALGNDYNETTMERVMAVSTVALGLAAATHLGLRKTLGLTLATTAVSFIPLPHLVRHYLCSAVTPVSDLELGDTVVLKIPDRALFIRATVTGIDPYDNSKVHVMTSDDEVDLIPLNWMRKEPKIATLLDPFSFAGPDMVDFNCPSSVILLTLLVGVAAIIKTKSVSSGVLMLTTQNLLRRYTEDVVSSVHSKVIESTLEGAVVREADLKAHHHLDYDGQDSLDSQPDWIYRQLDFLKGDSITPAIRQALASRLRYGWDDFNLSLSLSADSGSEPLLLFARLSQENVEQAVAELDATLKKRIVAYHLKLREALDASAAMCLKGVLTSLSQVDRIASYMIGKDSFDEWDAETKAQALEDLRHVEHWKAHFADEADWHTLYAIKQAAQPVESAGDDAW